jgi:hypothetical protein
VSWEGLIHDPRRAEMIFRIDGGSGRPLFPNTRLNEYGPLWAHSSGTDLGPNVAREYLDITLQEPGRKLGEAYRYIQYVDGRTPTFAASRSELVAIAEGKTESFSMQPGPPGFPLSRRDSDILASVESMPAIMERDMQGLAKAEKRTDQDLTLRTARMAARRDGRTVKLTAEMPMNEVAKKLRLPISPSLTIEVPLGGGQSVDPETERLARVLQAIRAAEDLGPAILAEAARLRAIGIPSTGAIEDAYQALNTLHGWLRRAGAALA